MPREMRKEGPRKRFRVETHENGKFIRSKWDKICDGKKVREIIQIRTLAEHFKATAGAIKKERTKKGVGGTWGKDIWEEDPVGTMCRRVEMALINNKQFKTHANAIAREIYIWAHPELQEEDWPSAEYFGKRRLR
jgi:hypothetical protein